MPTYAVKQSTQDLNFCLKYILYTLRTKEHVQSLSHGQRILYMEIDTRLVKYLNSGGVVVST